MNNWKLIIATVVIFGTGVVTGGLLVNYVKQHPAPKKNSRPAATVAAVTNAVTQTNNAPASPPRLPEMLSKPFLPKLDELLHLAPEQRKAIEKIISEGQGQMKKLMQDARGDIRNQLKGEQKKQFDDLMKWPTKKPSVATNAPVIKMPETPKKIVEVAATNSVELMNVSLPAAATNIP